MFVVLKNGKRFLEATDYQTACSEARKDAIKHRLSTYTVWNKSVMDRVRCSDDKPLYKVNSGMNYEMPNLPPAA